MKNKNMFDLLPFLSSEKLNSLKRLENTFYKIQHAWLSGYFRYIINSIFNSNSLENNKLNNKDQVITIISASQTGNAKLLSKRLYKYFKKNKKLVYLISAFDYKLKKIKNEKILILIISTQGKGKPPEEALFLYRFIISKKAPKLDHLYYSIFGLGDAPYNLFCQAGKDLDKRFKELGLILY